MEALIAQFMMILTFSKSSMLSLKEIITVWLGNQINNGLEGLFH